MGHIDGRYTDADVEMIGPGIYGHSPGGRLDRKGEV